MPASSRARRLGWSVVGAVLLGSGLRHMWLPEIYGRVRLANSLPIMHGWPVALVGLLEFAGGIYLIYRMWKRT